MYLSSCDPLSSLFFLLHRILLALWTHPSIPNRESPEASEILPTWRKNAASRITTPFSSSGRLEQWVGPTRVSVHQSFESQSRPDRHHRTPLEDRVFLVRQKRMAGRKKIRILVLLQVVVLATVFAMVSYRVSVGAILGLSYRNHRVSVLFRHAPLAPKMKSHSTRPQLARKSVDGRLRSIG